MDDRTAFNLYTAHQRMRELSDIYIRYSRAELHLLQRFLRDQPVLYATHDDLLRWADSLTATCSSGSRHVKLSRVHAFYEWAVETDLIERAPTGRIPRPRVSQGVPRPTP